MDPADDSGIVARLRTALGLYELDLELMRQNLRRETPSASDAEIRQRLLDWRMKRPDARDGDAVGRLVPYPRSRK